jgi:uncharacterized protein DUF4190
MKTCPTCNRTFTDEWLAYCTEDGTTLIEDMPAELSNEPPPTVFVPPAAATNPDAPKPFDLPGSYNPPQPVTPAWQPPPPPPLRPGNVQKQGLAVTSLILGGFSVVFGWCCSMGLLTAPVGIVLGIISLVQIKNDPLTNTGKPLSIIGICLSGFYVIVWFLIFMIYGMAIFMGALNQ